MSQHNHDHHTDGGAPHGTLKDYVVGFVLAVILTVIPFWLVMGDVLDSKTATVGWILAFAVVQVIVHVVYFLHMKPNTEGGWSFMAMIFTIITLVIALVGSIWVMRNLEEHMMPHTMGNSSFIPPSATDLSK
ncbi:cytochrome o ubiquinol oxidase subunit IV [Lampropedia puyangensis]|uniref:Cytochrome bo(3) ubiquinol oxidase subunit 4 n=1 Tax=Lampropedia puyangensis TaxID=1330072 RepID=A0A4S8F528_9BURK|nr:cytochrome o ubiquinol oxidase subunit IV [Lampropedia puyangensis]THU02543.1 cytochrome o ubiquinol oxidase subunit IV [Lampropedia puyangensis]